MICSSYENLSNTLLIVYEPFPQSPLIFHLFYFLHYIPAAPPFIACNFLICYLYCLTSVYTVLPFCWQAFPSPLTHTYFMVWVRLQEDGTTNRKRKEKKDVYIYTYMLHQKSHVAGQLILYNPWTHILYCPISPLQPHTSSTTGC